MPNNHLDFGVDLLPATTETYDLGNSDKKWNNIYGKTIYSNGTKVSVEGHTHSYLSSSTVVNKVKTTAKTDNVNYKLLGNAAGASPTSGNDYEAIYDTNVTLNPSTSTITAKTFAVTNNGSITYNSSSGCLEIIV